MTKSELFKLLLELPNGKTQYKVKFASEDIHTGTLYNYSEKDGPYFEIMVEDFGCIHATEYDEQLLCKEDPRINIIEIIDTESFNMYLEDIQKMLKSYNKIVIMCSTQKELSGLIKLFYENNIPYMTLEDGNEASSINNFEKDTSCKILIDSTNKLCCGYNLVFADFLVIVDTQDKLTKICKEQSIARCYRANRRNPLYLRHYTLETTKDLILL